MDRVPREAPEYLRCLDSDGYQGPPTAVAAAIFDP